MSKNNTHRIIAVKDVHGELTLGLITEQLEHKYVVQFPGEFGTDLVPIKDAMLIDEGQFHEIDVMRSYMTLTKKYGWEQQVTPVAPVTTDHSDYNPILREGQRFRVKTSYGRYSGRTGRVISPNSDTEYVVKLDRVLSRTAPDVAKMSREAMQLLPVCDVCQDAGPPCKHCNRLEPYNP